MRTKGAISRGTRSQRAGFQTKDLSVRQNYAALDYVLKFPNISRPRILLHCFERALIDVSNQFSHALCHSRENVRGEDWDIIGPLPQWRHVYRENVQAVI